MLDQQWQKPLDSPDYDRSDSVSSGDWLKEANIRYLNKWPDATPEWLNDEEAFRVISAATSLVTDARRNKLEQEDLTRAA